MVGWLVGRFVCLFAFVFYLVFLNKKVTPSFSLLQLFQNNSQSVGFNANKRGLSIEGLVGGTNGKPQKATIKVMNTENKACRGEFGLVIEEKKKRKG